MAMVLLYSFHIVLVERDSLLAIFIVHDQISMEFLSNSIVLERYDMLEEFYSSRTI